LKQSKNTIYESGKKIKYIHINDGIEDTKYTHGIIVKKNLKTGHVDHYSVGNKSLSIMDFLEIISDPSITR
jgi:hypothetical protein